MGIFAKKKKEETISLAELHKIFEEIKSFKKDFRLLHEKLEQKVETTRSDVLQYLYHIVGQLESLEQEIFKIERDLKKLSENIDERFKQTFSKIEEAESIREVEDDTSEVGIEDIEQVDQDDE